MKTLTPTQIQRIDDKLDELGRYHRELQEDLPSRQEFTAQRLTRRGIEKTIELIADTIMDVAMIIISAKGLEKPKDAAESISLLERHKFLTAKLSLKIQDLIRFRNLLVHRYAKVDEDKEYANIDENHEDILDFIREIEGLLLKEKSAAKVKKK